MSHFWVYNLKGIKPLHRRHTWAQVFIVALLIIAKACAIKIEVKSFKLLDVYVKFILKMRVKIGKNLS